MTCPPSFVTYIVSVIFWLFLLFPGKGRGKTIDKTRYPNIVSLNSLSTTSLVITVVITTLSSSADSTLVHSFIDSTMTNCVRPEYHSYHPLRRWKRIENHHCPIYHPNWHVWQYHANIYSINEGIICDTRESTIIKWWRSWRKKIIIN